MFCSEGLFNFVLSSLASVREDVMNPVVTQGSRFIIFLDTYIVRRGKSFSKVSL